MAIEKGRDVLGLRSRRWDRRAHWALTVYLDAREASGSFRSLSDRRGGGGVGAGGGVSGRSAGEASRRAAAKVRRYCAANALNRLGTLTYEGQGCHDPDRIREDLARFFLALRGEIVEQTLPLRHGVRTGGEFPYVWVPQWHPGGHGLHAHFVVGRYIPRRAIERAWGHGFVHIKLLSGLSTRSGPLEEARLAGRYASRYLLAQREDERRRLGLHRYEVAQGFQPVEELLRGDSPDELIDEVSQRFGCRPSRQWRSEGSEEWHGPPACWAIWPG